MTHYFRALAQNGGQFSASGIIRLFLVLLVVLLPVQLALGQSAIPQGSSDYLSVTGRPGSGDIDGLQVVFFRIPDTVTDTLYFSIFDPALNDPTWGLDVHETNPPDYDNNVISATDVNTTFYLVGGSGAYSDSLSRQVNFLTGGGLSAALSGNALATNTYTTNSSRLAWDYFAGVQPSDGEHIGNYYYFKIVAAADQNVDKNSFRLDVSLSNASRFINPVSGAQSFAYSWNLALLQRGNIWNLYPFVPDGLTGSVNVFNYHMGNFILVDDVTLTDGTGSTSNSNIPISDGGTARGYLSISGSTETSRTWHMSITESSVARVVNPAEVWAEDDDGNPLAIYSANFVEKRKSDHIVAVPEKQSTAKGEVVRVSLQVVDSLGSLVPYKRRFIVAATGGTNPITKDSSQPGLLPSSNREITTDANGLAWVEIKRGTPGDIILRIHNSYPGSGFVPDPGLPGSHVGTTVTFEDNPAPTLTGQNLTLVEGQPMPPPPYLTLKIEDSGVE